MNKYVICESCKGEKAITYSIPMGKNRDKIYDKNDIFDLQLMKCPNCGGMGYLKEKVEWKENE